MWFAHRGERTREYDANSSSSSVPNTRAPSASSFNTLVKQAWAKRRPVGVLRRARASTTAAALEQQPKHATILPTLRRYRPASARSCRCWAAPHARHTKVNIPEHQRHTAGRSRCCTLHSDGCEARGPLRVADVRLTRWGQSRGASVVTRPSAFARHNHVVSVGRSVVVSAETGWKGAAFRWAAGDG